MAVRHEVENLIRRGNIFYWRPRVPAVFTHCQRGSRLSLSLHCSDHKKAQVIGRKLNTRLAELKLHSKEAMSKQQLQKLFEHERDKELERLDDINMMSRRNGRGGDVVEMELDLEAGWACQLVAKFGSRVELTLESGCAGLTYLLNNGVPASHIDAIGANYRGELAIARSPGFEDGIRRDEGAKLRKAAELTGTTAKVGLAPTTIRKHFGNLQHFLKHLKGHGFQIESWTFEGLRPKKPKVGEIRGKQYKPSPQDIAPIFNSPLYVGSLGHLRGQRRAAGQQVFHDSLYYLPILFTYLGPRRREFAGLHVNDIARDGDGYVIILRSNGIRRLKNIQSQRMLPMPEEMVRLGFIEYVQAIKKLGYATLFPDLFSDKTENDPGDRFYDTFVPIMQTVLGEKMWERAIHAFRHGFADTLKQAGVSQDVIEDISGRLAEGNETSTRYTNPAGLPLMRSALQHYPIISSVIEPKPLQLLPWVEKRQPPPWAREGKK